jgi:Zn finger protein HypA/HybF involved in hydrogenase expression
MNDYKKMWNYLMELFKDNENWNLYEIMAQIENGTIMIECPECKGNVYTSEDGEDYYCEQCDWHKKKNNIN